MTFRAARNCQRDALGDWYRDPWSWPEVDFVASSAPEAVSYRLKKGGVTAYYRLDVPKENFGIRPALVLDPIDRLCYQALVDRIAVRMHKTLPAWVYGWRTARVKGSLYAKNENEWPEFVESVVTASDCVSWALTTDVVSFFRSTPIERVIEDVGSSGGSTMVTGALESMLHGWDRVDGRGGLPQRSAASAVLANFYLASVDDVLTVRGRPPRKGLRALLPNGSAAFRWMDDIWLFGASELSLRSAQMELQDAMSGLELAMNLGKTKVMTGDGLAEAVQSMHHSGIDAALNQLQPDEQPLEALIEALVESPSVAPRTSIRFAATRIKEHELFELAQEFVNVASLMPHGADHLGRLFRTSDLWSDLGEWWTSYRRSRSGKVDWSVAQLGLMFPADHPPPVKEVLDACAEELQSVGSLPMFSFAAHRMVTWAPNDARVLLREASKKADNPLHRRVIGVALSHCGATRAEIRSVLSQQETTAMTLRVLEHRNFRPPRVSQDYSGG